MQLPAGARKNSWETQYNCSCRHRSDVTTIYVAGAYPQLAVYFIFIEFKLLHEPYQDSWLFKERKQLTFPVSSYKYYILPYQLQYDTTKCQKEKSE